MTADYHAWITTCDRLLALTREGVMTADVAYDWRGAYEWGVSPPAAVREAARTYDAREK